MAETSPHHILVIEDHAPNASLVVDLLSFHGFRVTWASDGEKGLEMLKQDRPDLILMDIQMPRMDGYTLTRYLKADEDTRAIPIVALTACAMVGDAERALEAGCDGYLTKPVNTRELPKTVRRFLEPDPAATVSNGKSAVSAASTNGLLPPVLSAKTGRLYPPATGAGALPGMRPPMPATPEPAPASQDPDRSPTDEEDSEK